MLQSVGSLTYLRGSLVTTHVLQAYVGRAQSAPHRNPADGWHCIFSWKFDNVNDKWLPAGGTPLAPNEDIEHFRAELQSILEIASSLQQLQA